MGNICNSNAESNGARESVDTLVRVKMNGITVEIIHGNYRELRSETLINILEDTFLKNNTILTESTQNSKDVIASIQSSRKRSMISDAEKGLPFKRVVNCILPPYNSCDRKEYVTIVQNLFRDTLATKNNKEFLLVMCQTGDFNTIPNQLVVSLLFQLLLDNNSAKPVAEKIRLVSMDKNICNLFKLELSKVYAKHRSELEFERVRLYEIENEILY